MIGSEYKCPLCEATFATSHALCSHVRTHRTGPNVEKHLNTGPFVCRVCDTVFPTNKSLRLHRRMHDPVKAKEIEPPVEYGLSGEGIGAGEDEGGDPSVPRPRDMFTCPVCGKRYDKGYQQLHMQYHSGVNHYDCHICNRKFYTPDNLKMHMRVHGTIDLTGVRTSQASVTSTPECQHCKKQFDTYEAVEEHVKAGTCSTSRPYECSFCSRR